MKHTLIYSPFDSGLINANCKPILYAQHSIAQLFKIGIKIKSVPKVHI